VDKETTLVICDTEPVVVEGVKTLLHEEGMPRLVADETTVAGGMEAVSLLRPSVVLIDRAFGLQLVIEWSGRIRDSYHETAAIVWGCSFSEVEGLRFVQAGASGVMRKTAPLDLVRTCIRTVAAGGTWLEDALRHEQERSLRKVRSNLTSRELEVMELVEQGFKNKDIAGRLGICTGTVKIHLKHIFEKTGIRGRYGLALSGLKEKGLLSMPAINTM
jgi:two-component system, NarL family, nitrate/nitrite response regulator NarL